MNDIHARFRKLLQILRRLEESPSVPETSRESWRGDIEAIVRAHYVGQK